MGQIFIPGVGFIDDGQAGPSWQQQPAPPTQLVPGYSSASGYSSDPETAWNQFGLNTATNGVASNRAAISGLAGQSAGVGALADER